MTNLYFANLPSYLSETDLKLMIAPFGQVGRHTCSPALTVTNHPVHF